MGKGFKKRLEKLEVDYLGDRYEDLFNKKYIDKITKEEKRELSTIMAVLYERSIEERIQIYREIRENLDSSESKDLFNSREMYKKMLECYHRHIL